MRQLPDPKKFTQTFPILLAFLSYIMLCACSATYYSANSQNVPLMREQGDVKIQGGLAMGDETEKVEFQASGAVTDHWALMFNFCHYHDADNSAGNGNITEVGAGYYNTLNDKRWIYEAYAGYGLGDGSNRFSSSNTSFKLDRMFVQPNFGYSLKNFEIVVSLRGAYMNYRDVRQFHSNPELNYPLYEKGYYVLEPALTLRGGYKYLKVQLQISHSENLTQHDFYQDKTHVSAMLYIDLQRSFFK